MLLKILVLENILSFILRLFCLSNYYSNYHKLSILHTIFLDYFFNSKFFLTCFLQFVFVKCSNNIFFIKIINNIRPRHSIFNFFNHKNFFRPIWSVTFCKNIFIFWFSNIINSFKFWIFIISFFSIINICVWFYISRFRFNYAMICIIVFINYNI